MAKLGLLRKAGIILVVCTAAAIAAPAQTFTTLHSFDYTDGLTPSGLIEATDGNFYGTTTYGGAYTWGTVFKITPGGTLTTLYNFCAQTGCPDGLWPNALMQATDGNFYGTTLDTGGYDAGTVFQIRPDGTLTTLYSFCAQTNCTDGGYPHAGLMQATDGNFYGTTGGYVSPNCQGFRGGCGTVFKITPGGALTTLHNFNNTDGAYPVAGLIQATDGNFYGTTFYGGASTNCPAGCGTVFKITPEGALTTLHNFNFNNTDGAFPVAGLVQATDGNFYGTTVGGGANFAGTLFKITAAGTLTTLHSFCSQTKCFDGSGPGSLMQAIDGNFYGTNQGGGAASASCPAGCGTIFEIAPTGALATLHSFDGIDGSFGGGFPGSLMQATDGSFYGTTSGVEAANASCPAGCGTIFRLTVAPAVTLRPTSLSFGNQALDETSAAHTVTLKNSGTALLNVSRVAIDDGSFAISANTCVGVLAMGKTCTVSVTFTPKSLGKLTGTLSFTDNASSSPQVVLLSGTCVYPTSTTLSSSLNPSTYGQTIVFTAIVTTSGPIPPTGTVSFTWGYDIGTVTLNAIGVATLTRSNLNADPYPLRAVYKGDANNFGSASPVLNQTVLQTTSEATITSSMNPSTVGQAVTFTAKITSPTVIPSGPVTFKAGTTVLGTAQLSSGKAKFTTSTLPPGSTVVKVIYNGDSNIKESSASVTQTVQP
ncbi:exported hypothetical protein [Acidobacteriia bacterium SbA2]|nr:exported hypothetical protein [Acidobacteriia bacterium SbA2]